MQPRSDTNTTTHFMREPRALQAIVDLVVLPNARAKRDTVIWIVGCSTGDEPYSLAMLCAEAGASATILATDVNPEALEHAERGRYSLRNLRHVTDARRERWFRRDGSHWIVNPELRRQVHIRPHDVIREAAPRHDVDVVLCRNVMVHFTPDQVRCGVGTIVRSLRPGALFVLGAAEWLRAELRARDAARLVPIERSGLIVYQRVDEMSTRLQAMPTAPSPATPLPLPPPPTPSDEVVELRERGDVLLDGSRPLEALELFNQAVSVAPLLADLHLRIALCHLHTGQPAYAQKSLRSALFLTPQLWPAWLLMADLCHEPTQTRHCLDQARAHLEANLLDDPSITPFIGDRKVAIEAITQRLRVR